MNNNDILKSHYNKWLEIATSKRGTMYYKMLIMLWMLLPCIVAMLYILRVPLEYLKGTDIVLTENYYVRPMRLIGILTILSACIPFISVINNTSYVKKTHCGKRSFRFPGFRVINEYLRGRIYQLLFQRLNSRIPFAHKLVLRSLYEVPEKSLC